MLWIGERTRQPDGAHVEFFAGRAQPARRQARPDGDRRRRSLELCERLNPGADPGPADASSPGWAPTRVAELLPPLLRAVRDAEHPVVWACDPMHANIFTTAAGVKTRSFDAIMAEIEGFFAACRAEGVWPGGVHLEFTGEDVTECLGGSEAVLEEQLDAPLRDALRPAPERAPVARPRVPRSPS